MSMNRIQTTAITRDACADGVVNTTVKSAVSFITTCVIAENKGVCRGGRRVGGRHTKKPAKINIMGGTSE